MFTTLAQFRLFGRVLRTRPSDGRRSNEHPDDHFAATARRARRPTLVCRWQLAPSTAALECVWQSVEVPPAGRPRPDGRIVRLTEARAAARRPFIRSAA